MLSREHTEYRWVTYEEAQRLLKWDSNRNALWELSQRLGPGCFHGIDEKHVPEGDSSDLRVRVTGVLVEEGSILLVRQAVNRDRYWSLPGGKLEPGETLEQCLKREIQEETGLKVRLCRLLYICDRMEPNRQTLHITVEIRHTGGSLIVGKEPETDSNPISDVRMVSIQELSQYGFTETFRDLAARGFPDAGRYAGDIRNIGL